jgi:hypothetical protein
MSNKSVLILLLILTLSAVSLDYGMGGQINAQTFSAKRISLGNLPSNILNFGMVAQSGDWIYYSNSSDGWGLYKVKTDGTHRTKLTDYPVRFINVMDDWVYFCDFVFEEPSYLIKIKTDGTEQTIISKDAAYGVIIRDDRIYYTNDGFIYQIDLDGKNKRNMLDTRVNGFTLVDNYIFFRKSTDSMIYKVKIGDTKSDLVVNKVVEQFVVVDGWIYYTLYPEDGDNLYKITINGENDTKLSDDIVSYPNVMGNWVYYTNYSDQANVYKIDLEGRNKTKLTDERGIEINVIDDWVYYARGASLYKVRKNGTEKQTVE